MQLTIGFILAALVAYFAYRAHSLDKNGAFAAACVGTIVFGVGGWQWAILLLIFFITSSGLSRAFKQRKQGLSEKFSKGNERDAVQVLANGGVFAVAALLAAATGESASSGRCCMRCATTIRSRASRRPALRSCSAPSRRSTWR